MARTRGRDSLGPANRSGRRRKVVHVFTEGRVTEPEYIRIVRERAGATGVEVRIANASAPGSQRKPIKLVEAATRLMREETRAAKRSRLEKAYWPAVWCLFDRDQHELVEEALKQAEDAGVRVAFSHPCFEVWRLLHHKSVTGTFGGVCDMAAARLPFAKSAVNLKAVLPEQIPPGSYADARKRAEKMNAAHDTHVPKVLRDPYTDVFEFVEQGMGVTSY
ncbi:RloB family protein [Streptomyces sp. TP-A0874]|uniref:RloB family protein n=1 Tax=Streptomyces sp. TP-A0874 TaxID=549819 RepID=UPI000852F5AE|nr:RloB family protein [Streptomyces sp. TP-A0874]